MEEEEEGEATTILDTAMEAMEGGEEGELGPMEGEGGTNRSLTSKCALFGSCPMIFIIMPSLLQLQPGRISGRPPPPLSASFCFPFASRYD